MLALKFGGTSVGKIENIEKVVKLINNDQPKIVVLSAMSGITDVLYDITRLHKDNHKKNALEVIDIVQTRFYSTAEILLTDHFLIQKFNKILEEKVSNINQLLNQEYSDIIKNEIIVQEIGRAHV